MKIYFATWLFDSTLGISLTKKKAPKRLVSYHFLKEQSITSAELTEYCLSGKFDPTTRKK